MQCLVRGSPGGRASDRHDRGDQGGRYQHYTEPEQIWNPARDANQQRLLESLSHGFRQAIDRQMRRPRALYQRYSDDILIICRVGSEIGLATVVAESLAEHRLKLADDKTDKQLFDPHSTAVFQYLGFNISPNGAVIRPSSLARQWRKAKRAINKTKAAGLIAMSQGKASKIFVRKLRRRFSQSDRAIFPHIRGVLVLSLGPKKSAAKCPASSAR